MIPDNFYFSHDIDRLVAQLQSVYNQIAIGVNGDIRPWEPVVYGATTAGTTTYSHRSGWSFRRGLLVQLWMDVSWSAGTGTGNLAIELPYKVSASDNQPFVGFIENRSSAISFTGGYTYLSWRAEEDSFQSTIRENGSGVDSQALSFQSSGRLIGNISYIGQLDE